MLSAAEGDLPRILEKALDEREIEREEAVRLFGAEGGELMLLMMVADELRRRAVGDVVTYVHNRNINFTNRCVGSCRFCAFREDPGSSGGGFTLDMEAIAEKAVEAQQMGATEVCIQGGLDPALEPEFYYGICRTIKDRLPGMHIHGFSPMEVLFASRNAGIPVRDFLKGLKESGLDSMPGTAAEILDDPIRSIICPDKLTVEQWTEVMTTAHRLGIPSSATMMYGHVESPEHWAAHMETIREMQKRDGGFTEFVPLRFVHYNTRIAREGDWQPWLSHLDDLKVHAVARIMFHGYIRNIQVSWVKLGTALAQISLSAGANDLGGTLIEENISKTAGAASPGRLSVDELSFLIRTSKRIPVQRTTTYEPVEKSRA